MEPVHSGTSTKSLERDSVAHNILLISLNHVRSRFRIRAVGFCILTLLTEKRRPVFQLYFLDPYANTDYIEQTGYPGRCIKLNEGKYEVLHERHDQLLVYAMNDLDSGLPKWFPSRRTKTDF